MSIEKLNIINDFIEVLKEKTKAEKVESKFGFMEDLNIDNVIITPKGGIFLLSINKVESNVVSIDMTRNKVRKLNLSYITNNTIKDSGLSAIDFVENVIDGVLDDTRIKNKCVGLSYEYETTIEKKKDNDLTGTIIISFTINLTERRKH